VDEALLLADRVLVMREGGIAYDTAVGLDHPRGVGAPGFAGLRSRLLSDSASRTAAPRSPGPEVAAVAHSDV